MASPCRRSAAWPRGHQVVRPKTSRPSCPHSTAGKRSRRRYGDARTHAASSALILGCKTPTVSQFPQERAEIHRRGFEVFPHQCFAASNLPPQFYIAASDHARAARVAFPASFPQFVMTSDVLRVGPRDYGAAPGGQKSEHRAIYIIENGTSSEDSSRRRQVYDLDPSCTCAIISGNCSARRQGAGPRLFLWS